MYHWEAERIWNMTSALKPLLLNEIDSIGVGFGKDVLGMILFLNELSLQLRRKNIHM